MKSERKNIPDESRFPDGPSCRAGAKAADIPIVFVVGIGRSGTSLLQSMMNAHPHITFAPETQFVRRYVLGRDSERDTETLKDRITHDPRLAEAFGGEGKLASRLAQISGSDTRSIFQGLLQSFADEETRWLGDKDPRLLERSHLLLKIFPEAKIVHILRDPRDVLCSKMKAAWSRTRPWWLHVLISRAQLDMQAPESERFLTVSYETLIREPRQPLQRICDFLGLEYRDEMLNYYTSARTLIRESERAWKKNTTKPLMKTNAGRWREQLDPFQTAFTEAVMFSVPRIRDNYTPSEFSALGRLEMRLLRLLTAAIISLFRPVYRVISK